MPNPWTGGEPAVMLRSGVENRLVMSRSGGGPPVTAWTVAEIRALRAFLGEHLREVAEAKFAERKSI